MIDIFILTLIFINGINKQWKTADFPLSEIAVKINLTDSSKSENVNYFPLELLFNDTIITINDTFESVEFKSKVKYNLYYKFILKDRNDNVFSIDSLRSLKNCLVLYDINISEGSKDKAKFKVECGALYFP